MTFVKLGFYCVKYVKEHDLSFWRDTNKNEPRFKKELAMLLHRHYNSRFKNSRKALLIITQRIRQALFRSRFGCESSARKKEQVARQKTLGEL